MIVKPKTGANGTLRALHFSVVSGGRDAKAFCSAHEMNKFRSRRSKDEWNRREERSTFLASDKDPVNEGKESKVQKAQFDPETRPVGRSV